MTEQWPRQSKSLKWFVQHKFMIHPEFKTKHDLFGVSAHKNSDMTLRFFTVLSCNSEKPMEYRENLIIARILYISKNPHRRETTLMEMQKVIACT